MFAEKSVQWSEKWLFLVVTPNASLYKKSRSFKAQSLIFVKMGLRYLLLFTLLLLLTTSNIAYSSYPGPRCHPADGAALFRFLSSLEILSESTILPISKGGLCLAPNWKNQSVDCCSWDGVECDNVTGHVIVLDLSTACYKGNLSSRSTIFKLSYLQKLVLPDFSFERSSIPKEIGTLANLKVLHMPQSNLTGSIPTSLCNLKKLQELILYGNKLSGKLPSCIFDLTDLQRLGLGYNQLRGSLPANVSGLSNLSFLDLSQNLLDGKVPSWLFTIPSLESLYLNNNNLSGHIEPFQRPAVTLLSSLYLSNNSISGSIPLSLLQLVNLTSIDLSYNQLSGFLKWSMFKEMENLSMLILRWNRGLSIENDENSATVLPKLGYMDLAFCNLMEFPLVGIQSLYVVLVSHNQIHGRILTGSYLTSGWGNLQNLDASYNFITGFDKYPTNITSFDLTFNRLQGTLTQPPDGIQYLYLGHNNLTGKIPPELCKLDQLGILDLSFNLLTGNVPLCLVNISKSNPYFQLKLKGNHFNISSTL